MRVAALVPVKRFSAAKARLSGAVDEQQRAQLARWTATGVVGAFSDIDVYVACDNDDVAEWARELGHAVIWGPGLGLNGAIDDGVAAVADAGYDQIVIAHADLPRPTSLSTVARQNTITLVPDDRRDGTNVMSFPLTDTVQAAYGARSFERHLAAARQAGICLEVRADPDLALDIDTPDDLTHPLIREVLPTWLRTNQANRRSV